MRADPNYLAIPALVFGVAIIAIAMIGWWAIREPAPWLGSETGLFDAYIAVLTLAGVAIGAYGAFISYQTGQRTLEQAIISDRSTRFQKAAEMVGADNEAVAIAGLELIVDIANEEERYRNIALHVVTTAIDQRDGPVKRRAAEAWRTKTSILIADDVFPTRFAEVALACISSLRRGEGWPPHHMAVVDGRLCVYSLFLIDCVVHRQDLRAMLIPRAVARNVHFHFCDMRGTRIDILYDGKIDFIDSDLRGAAVRLFHTGGKWRPTEEHRATFKDCTIDETTTVNETPIVDWLQRVSD